MARGLGPKASNANAIPLGSRNRLAARDNESEPGEPQTTTALPKGAAESTRGTEPLSVENYEEGQAHFASIGDEQKTQESREVSERNNNTGDPDAHGADAHGADAHTVSHSEAMTSQLIPAVSALKSSSHQIFLDNLAEQLDRHRQVKAQRKKNAARRRRGKGGQGIHKKENPSSGTYTSDRTSREHEISAQDEIDRGSERSKWPRPDRRYHEPLDFDEPRRGETSYRRDAYHRDRSASPSTDRHDRTSVRQGRDSREYRARSNDYNYASSAHGKYTYREDRGPYDRVYHREDFIVSRRDEVRDHRARRHRDDRADRQREEREGRYRHNKEARHGDEKEHRHSRFASYDDIPSERARPPKGAGTDTERIVRTTTVAPGTLTLHLRQANIVTKKIGGADTARRAILKPFWTRLDMERTE